MHLRQPRPFMISITISPPITETVGCYHIWTSHCTIDELQPKIRHQCQRLGISEGHYLCVLALEDKGNGEHGPHWKIYARP